MSENTNPDYQALLKRSLVAIEELESKLAAAERRRSEPIAIVGIGCRFPGGANDPESFWKLLVNGVDAVTEVPRDRWDVDRYFDPDPDAPGKTYTRWGAFLKDFDRFDAHFFGISPREAVELDPQQRLLLELSWEALEQAGIAPSALAGSRTAVYIGVTGQDYAMRHAAGGDAAPADAYTASGSATSMASGRLSYVFGLHGPNVALDTACSSSLVALHWGVQSLRLGEADLALAGAANMTLIPAGSILTSRARMMSFTGRCRTFDAAADGYVRGEGGGILVLKRLSDAERHGDHVLAVIRGSAINQDGRSSGLTAPNGLAQEAVIRDALANAQLRPEDIDCVEAHGTGTALGDPIEVRALGEVFGRAHSPDAPLYVASVKTNIGHLEAAAGVAGVAKAILALQHRVIPPHLHLEKPNPLIPWERYPIVVPTKPVPWTAQVDKPRRVGVSSFGFSGTNAHVILEEAPRRVASPSTIERPQHLLVLSAQTPEAVTSLTERYAEYMERGDAAPLGDIAMTAALGRSHFSERLAIVASSIAEAREKLASVAAGVPLDERAPGIISGHAVSGSAPEIVFLFTGQGAQYAGMSRRLYETQPTFRRSLDRCAQLVEPTLGEPLLPVIFGEGAADRRLHNTAFTQPALFAVEYALAQLWQSWGIEPTAVMGHSVGEYVAACVSGVFSLEDGLALVAARGRLMSRLPRNGAMAAVFANEARVRDSIIGDEARIAIAGVNGPENTVISGEQRAIDAAVARLSAQGFEWQALNVSHAFHSPLMEPILDEFESIARGVTFASPRIGLVSNITGRLVTDEVRTAEYWRRHIRAAVRFSDSIATLDAEGYHTFLEVGPSPTLLGMGRRCLADNHATWLPSLREGKDDWTSMLGSLGQLYVRGATINWTGFDADYSVTRQRVALPTYPFQRQRYWKESTTLTPKTPRPATTTGHPFLQEVVPGPLETFESRLSVAALPYLSDHRIFDLTPFPATGFVEVGLAAGREIMSARPFTVRDMEIQEALIVPPDGDVVVRVVVAPAVNGIRTFQIFGLTDGTISEVASAEQWRLHASGTLAPIPDVGHPETSAETIDALRTRCPRAVSVDEYYRKMAKIGATYGQTFRGIVDIRRSTDEVIGRVELPGTLLEDAARYALHPALLDACFQLIGVTLPGADALDDTGDIYLPIAIGTCRMAVNRGAVTAAWCHVLLRSPGTDPNLVVCDATLYDDAGSAVATLTGVTYRRLDRFAANRAVRQRNHDSWIHEIAWRPVPLVGSANEARSGRWIILTESDEPLCKALVSRLRAESAEVVLVYAGETFGMREDGWQVRPSASDDLQRVLAASRDAASPHRIISLWGISRSAAGGTTLAQIEAHHAFILRAMRAAALAAVDDNARLCLVTRGAQPVAGSIPDVVQAPGWGFGGAIASEYPALQTTRIDLDPVPSDGDADALIENLVGAKDEPQVAVRNGARYVARLASALLPADAASRPLRLDITTRGMLENLSLTDASRTPPGPGQVELLVHATGLNFRDVLNALGMYPGDAGPLGNECAGVITSIGAGVHDLAVGDEVIAMVDRSFATYVIAAANLTVRKPKNLSFAEAATIPVAFLTAQHALQTLGRIAPGDRVLIHAATGGVGMAAIQLAKRAGAEIFGTAGTPDKRELAQSLGASHVSDSRSLSFADDVMAATRGEGVDIVLNSLSGDFIPKSLGVLRRGGRFIEIGKTAIWDAERVAAEYPAIEYFALYLGAIAAAEPLYVRNMLLELLPAFESGALSPLPIRSFPLDRAAEAFRFMAQAKHTGKVVVTQHHAPVIRADATYLITGGLGGLGLLVARALAADGAKHVVLMGRRAPSAKARTTIEQLEANGVRVVIVTANVAETADIQKVLVQIDASLPALRGVIHAAGVVDDAMLPEQDDARLARVLSPKVAGAWNLHTLTRDIPLDFFVLFSAGAAILGSPGQANYAAANLFLDAIAHERQARGLPGLSINWGIWDEVGMVADAAQQHRRRWAALGLGLIKPDDGIAALQRLMSVWRAPQAAVLPLDGSKLNRIGARLFDELLSHSAATATTASGTDILARLRDASAETRTELLEEFLADQLTRVLALEVSYRIDPDMSLMNMGLDSLMAMELRNRLQNSLKITVPVAQLLQGPSIHQLASTVRDMMRLAGASATNGAERDRLAPAAPAGDDHHVWEEGTL